MDDAGLLARARRGDEDAFSGLFTRDAQIVRMQVPRTALASFGLAPMESVDESSRGTVLADVVVGEDGWPARSGSSAR